MAVKVTYFVHGTTYDNASGKCSGWKQVELNELEKEKIDSLVIDVRNNNGGYLSAVEDVKTGKADCIIMDSDAHSINYKDRRDSLGLDKKNKIDKPIIIEDDVLIGTRCIIMKGVTIGARSIIGAGSVVTKDIPPYSVAVGVPAKVIKQRI